MADVDPRKVAGLITTGMDVAGVVAVAVGVTAGLFPVLGWYAVAVGGVVFWAASWWITTQPHPMRWLRAHQGFLRWRRRRAARGGRLPKEAFMHLPGSSQPAGFRHLPPTRVADESVSVW